MSTRPTPLRTLPVPARLAAGQRRPGWRLGALAAAAALAAASPGALAAPSGAQVVSGSASISGSGTLLTVKQTTPKAAINWQSFGIAAGETVRFEQPDAAAVALNRVLGQEPSAILGRLQSNGQVFLINPNGVLFGRGAEVDVGSLVASTLALSDADFQAGRWALGGDSRAAIVNQGQIRADGGSIVLLGSQVSNQGTLQARLGAVTLAAGQKATLDFHGDRLISVSVDQGALDALAENRELIQADGGRVTLSAKAADHLTAAVVNNSGIVQARTLQNQGGVIRLLGDMEQGVVRQDGTLDASAPQGGNGGFVETSAAKVQIGTAAKVSTAAANGSFGDWLIDPQDYRVAASGGDISGAALSAALAGSNVTLQSSAGASAGTGSLHVDDAVNWSANTRLSLVAARDVYVNASLTATGATAGLSISPNTANGSDAAAGSGSFKLGNGAQINLPNVSASSTSALVIAGTPYTVINSLGSAGDSSALSLQGMNGNLSGHYALGSDIDARATAGWNSRAGFTPIGSGSSAFAGTLDGLGHSISGLSISRSASSNVGLVGWLGSSGAIRNLSLDGGSISGLSYVGALVGSNDGSISKVHGSATVSAGAGSDSIGGLVGMNFGSISEASSAATVSGANAVGGLLGTNAGSLSQSFASATVNGLAGGLLAGGLVGENAGGSISMSYSTGSVSGNSRVGGLVGGNSSGAITSSYASGSVSGNTSTGGLVGANLGSLSSTYWNSDLKAVGVGSGSSSGASGLNASQLRSSSSLAGFSFSSMPGASGWVIVDVDGSLNNAAGATGATLPMLASEYATRMANAHQLQLMAMAPAAAYSLARDIDASATQAARDVWGSAGFVPVGNAATPFSGSLDGASHSIAALSINAAGRSDVGLIGSLSGGSIANIGLNGGSVSGQTHVGGLVGYASAGQISNVYNSGSVVGGASGDAVGGLVGYSTNNTSISTAYASGAVSGRLNVGGLVGYNAGGTIDDSYASGGVSGQLRSGGLVGYAYAGNISDSFWASDATATGIGAGSSSGAQGLSNAQLQTRANFVAATAANGNANPGWDLANSWILYEGHTAPLLRSFMTPLSVSANTATKVYDGQALGGFSVSYSATPDARLLGTASFGGSATSATQVGSYTLTAGGLYSTQQGYAISFVDASASITPASLRVVGTTVANKVYDGSTAASLSGGTLSGLVAGDVVHLSQAGSFATRNAGTAIAVTAADSISGPAAGNYLLVQPSSLSASITPKPLSMGDAVVAVNKSYDGTTQATLSGGRLSGLIAGDSVTLSQTGLFATRNAGTGIAVSSTSSLGGADAANYSLVQPSGLAAAIMPKTLLIGSGTVADDKVYDGNVSAQVHGGLLSGVVAGDSVALTQAGAFADKNAANHKPVAYTNSIAGADAGNYVLSSAGGTVYADISPRTLEVRQSASANKVYDASTTADLSGNLFGLLAGDTVFLAGTFDNKNVGTAKTVSYKNQLTGVDSGNYSLASKTGSVSADITAKTLTVTGTTVADKVYDGKTVATVMGGGLVGVVGGDRVELVQSGVFATKNAGRDVAVQITDTLRGAAAGNYLLVQPSGLTADITPKALRVIDGKVAAKEYDGTTAATMTGGKLSGVIKGDSVTLTQNAQFADKDAGTGKIVFFTNQLSGSEATNYSLVKVGGTKKASIKPMLLEVDESWMEVLEKTYDGTRSATVIGAEICCKIGFDDVSLVQTGEFSTPKVGEERLVNIRYSLIGRDAKNYKLDITRSKTYAEILEP